MSKLKPVNDKIVVKTKSKEEEVTEGGILLPDTVDQGKLMEGEVVAVGPGAKNEDGKITLMDVKVGDIVLFGKWSGTEVKIDGKEYSIMKESDIMGISKSK
jgi:chaperonin GroES